MHFQHFFEWPTRKKVFPLIMKTVEEAVVKANWFVLCTHISAGFSAFFVLLMHEKLLKTAALVSYTASVLTSLSPLKHVCQDSHSNKPLIMAVYDTSFHPRLHCKSLLLTVVYLPLITLAVLSSSWVILETSEQEYSSRETAAVEAHSHYIVRIHQSSMKRVKKV